MDLFKWLIFYCLWVKVELEVVSDVIGVFVVFEEELFLFDSVDLVVWDFCLLVFGWCVVGFVDSLVIVFGFVEDLFCYYVYWIVFGVFEGGYDFDYFDIFLYDVDMD